MPEDTTKPKHLQVGGTELNTEAIDRYFDQQFPKEFELEGEDILEETLGDSLGTGLSTEDERQLREDLEKAPRQCLSVWSGLKLMEANQGQLHPSNWDIVIETAKSLELMGSRGTLEDLESKLERLFPEEVARTLKKVEIIKENQKRIFKSWTKTRRLEDQQGCRDQNRRTKLEEKAKKCGLINEREGLKALESRLRDIFPSNMKALDQGIDNRRKARNFLLSFWRDIRIRESEQRSLLHEDRARLIAQAKAWNFLGQGEEWDIFESRLKERFSEETTATLYEIEASERERLQTAVTPLDIGEDEEKNFRPADKVEMSQLLERYQDALSPEDVSKIKEGQWEIWAWGNERAFVVMEKGEEYEINIHETAVLKNCLVFGPANIGKHAYVSGAVDKGSIVYNTDIGDNARLSGSFHYWGSEIGNNVEIYVQKGPRRKIQDCEFRDGVRMAIVPAESDICANDRAVTIKGREGVFPVVGIGEQGFEHQVFEAGKGDKVNIYERTLSATRVLALALRDLSAPTAFQCDRVEPETTKEDVIKQTRG
ncbi:MAG: hypothetical protein V1746_02335 [bacterium]